MDEEQQLSLFGHIEVKMVELFPVFEIGDRVQIIIPEYKKITQNHFSIYRIF